VLGVLREFGPVKAKARPDDYFFTGPQGGPVYTRDWAEDYGFFDVLTRLKVRQRKFYATRHTFISWSLTAGANPFGVAAYCGTSVQMIQEYYGKWIPDRGLDLAVLRP
jgi:integrase